MRERFREIHDRLLYPSSQDGKEVLKKLVPPSSLLMLAGVVHHVSSNKSDVIAGLGEETAEKIDDLSKKAGALAVPGLLTAGVIFTALSIREVQNRVPFGQYLTVSKVACNSAYRLLYPNELADERFVGEMHFKGKWKSRYSGENPHTVMANLFHDLYILAEAVEKNDPKLKDFNYFIGVSTMVNPLLGRFGFKVVHYKDQIGLPPLGDPDQARIVLKRRPVMAAMINKKELLEHKKDLARFGH